MTDIELLQSKSTLSQRVFKNNYPEIYEKIMEYASKFNITDWPEAKYIYTYQLKELPKCKICGKKAVYYKSLHRYRDTCSKECDKRLKSQSHHNTWINYTEEERKQRLDSASQVRLQKSGYSTPFANPEVQKKIKETFIRKYNIERHLKNN